MAFLLQRCHVKGGLQCDYQNFKELTQKTFVEPCDLRMSLGLHLNANDAGPSRSVLKLPRLSIELQFSPLEINVDIYLVHTLLKVFKTWKPMATEPSSLVLDNKTPIDAVTPFSHYIITNQTPCAVRYGQHKCEESLLLPPHGEVGYSWYSTRHPQVKQTHSTPYIEA